VLARLLLLARRRSFGHVGSRTERSACLADAHGARGFVFVFVLVCIPVHNLAPLSTQHGLAARETAVPFLSIPAAWRSRPECGRRVTARAHIHAGRQAGGRAAHARQAGKQACRQAGRLAHAGKQAGRPIVPGLVGQNAAVA